MNTAIPMSPEERFVEELKLPVPASLLFVAYPISMIAVQAKTAPYTLDNLGNRTKQEFSEIAASARTTLTEMRRLLGVLRADIPTAP